MNIKFYLIIAFTAFLMTSCLDMTNEDYEREKTSIDSYLKKHGYTDDNKIFDGIYIKVFSAERNDTTYPGNDDILITSMTAYDFYDEVTVTTDSAIAESNKLYNEYYVYGPIKFALKDFLYGIAIGLSHTNQGDSIEMVISSEYIGTDYEPWVVRAKVHEIILEKDIENWEKDIVDTFTLNKGYTTYKSGIYYKKNIVTENDSLEPFGTASLRIVARYAEFKDKYSPYTLGRICYPLGESDTIVDYEIGDGQTIYPFCDAIDLLAKDVGFRVGEQIEIVTTSEYAFGESGVVHSSYGNYVVPTYTPIQYVIDVKSVEN